MKKYIFMVVCVLVAGCNTSKPDIDPIGACVYARQFVEQQLRSPSTAEFASCAIGGETSVVVLNKFPAQYEVRSYVDAQNAFGGTVRQHYVVRIERIKEQDSWSLLDMQIQ